MFKFIYYFFMLLLININIGYSNWGDYPKKITGKPAPILKLPPYTTMTNQGNGVWRYSAYFIPGETLTIKFMVSTNGGTSYISELQAPREFNITFGTSGNTYFITNTPLGLLKVTEGSNTNNAYMMIEFNWEDAPDTPTGLYVYNATPTSAELKWNYSKELDIVGYNVYLSNNFYPYYRKVNKNIITTNYFKFTNLLQGATNYVYVTAVDFYTNMPNYESERSSVIKFISDRYITVKFYLKKRRADVLDAIYIGGENFPLDWNLSQKMTYLYNDLWYYKAKFIKGTKLVYKYNIDKDSSKWEEDFNTPSKNREVVASGSGNEFVINDVWSIENIENSPPAAPSNVIAIPLNHAVQLYWSKNKEIDFKEYRIYRSKLYKNQFQMIKILNNTNFLDNNLSNDTNYYYKITALDINGNESSYSVLVTVTPSTNGIPVVPSGLRGIAYDSKVVLKWNKNPESDIAGYLLYRATKDPVNFINIGGIISTTYYTDTSVTNNVTYYYKLRAIDTILQTNEGFSEMINITPSTNSIPYPPGEFQLKFTKNNGFIVEWKENEESDVNLYRIYYQKENSAIEGPFNITNNNVYEINNLTSGEKYKIWVTAVDSIGQESSPSEVITAYPVPSITDLKVLPSGTESGAVKLNWTSPEKAGNLGYPQRFIIKYSDYPITNFTSFQNATTFIDMMADISGSYESLKVNNLGTDCRGYYFTIAAIYGEESGFGFSESLYNVSSMVLSPAVGGTFRKVNSKLKVIIPPYVLPDNASAIVIKSYEDLKKEKSSLLSTFNKVNDSLKNYPSISLINGGTNTLFDISIINYGGDSIVTRNRLNGSVQIYLPFNDSNHNLIVDETEGKDKIKVNNLRMFWADENSVDWALIENVSIDNINNYVIGRVNHFTLFNILAKTPADNLNKAIVYPNPAYKPDNGNPVIFTRLTANAEIKIYTISGELVKSGLKADSTGVCKWDSTNNDGKMVASGVYLYYIKDGINEPAHGKLAIIR